MKSIHSLIFYCFFSVVGFQFQLTVRTALIKIIYQNSYYLAMVVLIIWPNELKRVNRFIHVVPSFNFHSMDFV